MGVDYVQNRDCRVKRELGLDTLVCLIKSRTQAALLQAHFRERGEDPATANVKRIIQYPSGPVEENVGMAELLEAGAVLAPYEPVCAGCTANFQATPFGCCGYLNYPISAVEENWLMSRLPASADSVAGIYLRNVLRELEIDGGPVAGMRRRHGLYFERPETIVRTWAYAGGTAEVTSDQMLQLVFYSGGIGPAHAAFVCLFVGLIPHGVPGEVMQSILQSPNTMQDHFTIDQEALTILEETQLGVFLLGMMSAAINLETLLIDA